MQCRSTVSAFNAFPVKYWEVLLDGMVMTMVQEAARNCGTFSELDGSDWGGQASALQWASECATGPDWVILKNLTA